MFTLVIVIHLIVSIVLTIAVLLQQGKGADIGSAFGGASASSQTIFGSAGPATLLAKVTGVCAAIFMVTSIFLTYQSSRAKSSSIMSTAPVKAAPAQQAPAPAAPATTAPAAPVQPLQK